MTTSKQRAAAKAKEAAASATPEPDEATTVEQVTFVDDLPAKPKVTRTTWWDGVRPQLDANPGKWALVYTGTGDKPDRNALARSVRLRQQLKAAELLDSTYAVEKRGDKVYAQRIAS